MSQREGWSPTWSVWGAGVFLTASLLLCPVLAFAQAPDVQPRDEAPVLDQRLRDEATQQLQPSEEPPQIEEAEAEEPPAQTGDARFFVRRIELDGNTVITREEVQRLVAPYENREVTLTELNLLAQAIEQHYRQRGFVTSRVIIPPQDLVNQTVALKVIEGQVGQLHVEGNRFFSTKQIVAYSRLRQGEILRYSRLRADLARMSQHPDRKVQTILRRGEAPETTDIVLHVKDRSPLHAGLSFDNKGSQGAGRYRTGLSARHANLSGHDDTLLAGAAFGRDFGAVYTQYRLPIPQTDTTLSAGVSHAQVSPKKGLKVFGVNGISQTYFGRIEQKLLERERFDVDVQLGVDIKESRTKVRSGAFRRERLRVLRMGPTWRERDRFGRTDWSHEFSLGINGLGAAIHEDPSSARRGVKPYFLVYSAKLLRLQQMPLGTHLQLRGEYQFASRKLPSSEGLYLGGATSVRGYPEGDYTADYGFLANAEYVAPLRFLPKQWVVPLTNEPWRDRLEWAGFVDVGYGKLKGPSISETGKRHLIGIGAGVRVRLFEQLYARVDWAYALGQDPLTEASHSRFHVTLQYEF